MHNNRQSKRGFSAGAFSVRRLIFPVLLLLITVSAVGVVYTSHQTRQLFNELQVHKRQSMMLDEDWGRLLLEESTWASHDRTQQLAQDKLSMIAPRPAAVKVVRADGKTP